MTDIRCKACNELNDYNAFKCESCKATLSDSNISEVDVCENDYRFIEEAELNGEIYKLENLNEDSVILPVPNLTNVLKDENAADFKDSITEPDVFPSGDGSCVDEGPIIKSETISLNLDANETISEPPYQCDQCSKSFKRRATLKAHVKKDHNEDTISLYRDNKSKTKSSAKFTASSASNYSSEYTPSEQQFHCNLRGTTTRSQFRTKRKGKNVSDKTVCKSTTTAKKIKASYKLNNNNVSKTKPKLKGSLVYKCTACEKITHNYNEHRKHIVIHQAPPDSLTETTSLEKLKQTPSGFIKCKECDCVFMTQRDYALHQKTHQGGNIFQCDVCHAELCNRSSLRKHKIRMHKRKSSVKQEKNFECIICHEKFPAQILMIHHRRTHTEAIKKLEEMTIIEKREGKTVYVCKICAKTSKNKYRHEEHIRIHTGEKPYKCEQCGAGIATANALVHHLRLHENDRPFKCDICEATYRHKKSLKKHLILHTGEKRFKCRYCVKKFPFNYTRADHERNCHIDESNVRKRRRCLSKDSEDDMQNDDNNVNCEHCKDDLLDESSPLVENWEHEFRFIEEAEEQGNVYEISAVDDGLYKIEPCEGVEICQDIKHEPEIQIEPENEKREGNLETEPVQTDHSTANFYKCSNCKKSFKREAALKAHINFEHKDVLQLITNSNESVTSKSRKKINTNLKNQVDGNISESLNNGFWKCAECDMVFSVKFDLKMHKNQHEGKEVFQCDICKAYLTNSKILTEHKMKLHNTTTENEKKFRCTICGEQFSLQVLLSNHKKTHVGYVNHLQETADIQRVDGRLTYICKTCGKTSTNKSRHEEHLRVHTKERPFKCSLCGAEFTAKCSLVQHIRLHSDERPFKCEICSQTYRHKKNLVRHLLKHSGQLPYKCRYCDKAFSLNSIKYDHERLRHTGETPYQCEVCKRRFKTSFQLNNHRRNKHNMVTNSKPRVEILIKKNCNDTERSKGKS